jgi:hypothetical protein
MDLLFIMAKTVAIARRKLSKKYDNRAAMKTTRVTGRGRSRAQTLLCAKGRRRQNIHSRHDAGIDKRSNPFL